MHDFLSTKFSWHLSLFLKHLPAQMSLEHNLGHSNSIPLTQWSIKYEEQKGPGIEFIQGNVVLLSTWTIWGSPNHISTSHLFCQCFSLLFQKLPVNHFILGFNDGRCKIHSHFIRKLQLLNLSKEWQVLFYFVHQAQRNEYHSKDDTEDF